MQSYPDSRSMEAEDKAPLMDEQSELSEIIKVIII